MTTYKAIMKLILTYKAECCQKETRTKEIEATEIDFLRRSRTLTHNIYIDYKFNKTETKIKFIINKKMSKT